MTGRRAPAPAVSSGTSTVTTNVSADALAGCISSENVTASPSRNRANASERSFLQLMPFSTMKGD